MFVPLGNQGVYVPAIQFHLNMYTGPTYVYALLDIINIVLIVAVFQDCRFSSKKKESFCAKSEKKGKNCMLFVNYYYYI